MYNINTLNAVILAFLEVAHWMKSSECHFIYQSVPLNLYSCNFFLHFNVKGSVIRKLIPDFAYDIFSVSEICYEYKFCRSSTNNALIYQIRKMLLDIRKQNFKFLSPTC